VCITTTTPSTAVNHENEKITLLRTKFLRVLRNFSETVGPNPKSSCNNKNKNKNKKKNIVGAAPN